MRLSLAEKIFFWEWRSLRTVLLIVGRNVRARELFQELGMSIDPETRCQDLTVAEQQTVEIARALASDARIIVMDEPTAALSQQEVDKSIDHPLLAR